MPQTLLSKSSFMHFLDEVETAFAADLAAGMSYKGSGKRLTLTGASGTVYTFERN